MDVGVDSFAAVVTDPDTGAVVESAERMAHLLEEIELADRVGLAAYGIGRHHRIKYYDTAPQSSLRHHSHHVTVRRK